MTKREGAGVPRPAQKKFEPKPGLVVAGKYRVERVIGEGGMGIVVAATHEELDQRVAIKFLSPDAMGNEEAVERFLREAKVAARVKSEHVARVSDVGRVEARGVPFIVMEYLEGSDLGALIAEADQKRLPVEEACEIALQACEALAEVHAAGIVHRDLKPSNLFVTRRSDESPCVKLLDFGISKAALPDESVDPALTSTATIMGSPSYMSPEQLRSTKEVDARTDVWALGAVLYEAVSGRPAFRGETVPQVCFMIGSEEPAAPSSLRAEIPPELERIILACLDKKVDTRASLVDLARVLVAYAPERARVSLERVEAVLGAGPPRKRDPSMALLAEGRRASQAEIARRASQAEIPRRASQADIPRRASVPQVARTQASWHDDEQERRSKRKKGGGGGALLLLLLVVGGVFGVGVYTGRINLAALRGQVSSATSAVGSAVASATAHVASAIPSSFPSTLPSTLGIPSSIPIPSSLPTALPSSLPIPIPLPDIEPVPDPAASDWTDDEEEPGDAAAAPSAVSAPSSIPPSGGGGATAGGLTAPAVTPARTAVPPRAAPVKHPPRPRHYVHKAWHKRR
jgi:serine/threonine-protein kinase